jgi:hypothetical protein
MERFMSFPGVEKKEMRVYRKGTWKDLMFGAITYADGFIQGSETIDPEVAAVIKATGKPFLPYQSTETNEYIEIYNNFYDSLLPPEED